MANRAKDREDKFDSFREEMEAKYGGKKETKPSSTPTTTPTTSTTSKVTLTTGASKEDRDARRKQNFDSYRAEMNARYNKSAEVNDAYINAFFNDAQSFLSRSSNSLKNISWQSATSDRTSWNNEYDALRGKAEKIRTYLRDNKDTIDPSAYKQVTSLLDDFHWNSIDAKLAFRNANKYYSQWDSEEKYNWWDQYNGKSYDELSTILGGMEKGEEKDWLTEYAGYIDQQEKLSYDLNAGAKELETLQKERDELKKLQEMLFDARYYPDKYSQDEVDAAGTRYKELIAKHGDYRGAEDAVNKQREYIAEAERLQHASTLASVTDPYSKNFDPEFRKYTDYVSTEYDNIWGKMGSQYGLGYEDLTYEYINGAENGMREEILDKQRVFHSDLKNEDSEKYKIYDSMTEDQIATYNYYYSKYGRDEAEAYIDSIQIDLEKKRGAEVYKPLEGKPFLEFLFSTYAGIDQFETGVKGLGRAIIGNDEYVAPSAIQFASSMVREDLAEVGPNLPEWMGGGSLGQAVYDFGVTSANMAPSILVSTAVGLVNPTAGAIVGNTMMGASAGGNAYIQKINLGYTHEEATAYGVMVGASEALLQYALGGVGKLGGKATEALFKNLDGLDNVLARVAKSAGGRIVLNATSEAFEEGLQSIIEPYLWQAVAGGNANVDWEETLYSALMGFVTGGVFEGAEVGKAAIGKHIDTSMKNTKIGRDFMDADGAVNSLMMLADDVAGVTTGREQKNLMRQIEKVSSKMDKGSKSNSTAREVAKLYNAVKGAYGTQNHADIVKALTKGENGFSTKDANKIAGALVAMSNGLELTEEQTDLLNSVRDNSAVLGIVESINSNDSLVGQRNMQLRQLERDVAVNTIKKDITKAVTEKEFTPEGIYETSSGNKAIRTDTNEEIDIKRVKEIGKGKLVLELADGQTIDVKNVSFANEADALIYEAVGKLGDNIDVNSANQLIAQYKGGDAMVFARGIAQAYTYGFYGIDKSELFSKHSLADKLTDEQREFAYNLGKEYRPTADKIAKDKAGEKMAKTGKTPGEKGVYYRDKNGNATDIDSYLEQDNRHLNDLQKSGIEMMRKLSEMMGIRFNVFESWVENGESYYLDENGEVTKGDPNGFYDTVSGEVYIALNAGSDYQGTMVFTIAHEVTHFMRQWSPEHFTKIAEIVFQHGEMKGSVSELAALKMANAKRKGKPISYDVALEEVVADGMETILKNGKVVQFMADVKQKDHPGWQKLKGWFMKLAKFLRAYIGKQAHTVEGRKVSEFSKDLLSQIEQIYAEGAVEGGSYYQEVVDGYKAEQAKFSTANMQGNADGAVVQSDAATAIVESKEQPRTEYEAFPKQVMSLSDGAGTLLHSIEGLNPKKLKGLSGRTVNGYTGRDVRAWAMGINGFTEAQIQEVNKFMDSMADFMEEAGVTYKFIGLQDVQDAKLHYTYNSDGSIKSIVLSAMVKNGDYPVNFDLSSICKKREAMSKLVDILAKSGSLDNGTVKLTPDNIFKINTALKDAGYETACLGCFVESKRYNSLEWAKKFCDKWNAAVKKVNPNATYFGYGNATFNEDSFTLEQAIKIEDAANKYITTTKTERLANALKKYQAKADAGQPLVASFSKAARDRLIKSDTISDELKDKYLNSDVSTWNMADVEFLLENGVLPGASLSNKQAVTEMVKSGEAYQHLLRPSDLLTDRGISKLEALPNFHGVLYGHYGSGTPKLMQSYTPYNSEIALLPANKNKDQSLEEYLYSIAGVRMQSFSDFQIQNIYDYLQMVADLSARKLPAHAYTKEISFAKLLGMTGIKTNLSVMFDIDPMVDKAHAGLTKLNKLVHRGEYAVVVLEDAQGKWVYNIGDYQTQRMFAEAYPDEAKRFLQSIGFADAVKLQTTPGYSANCGIIGVGYSDLGIFAMLNDKRIRYIIPYHASSLPADIKVATNIALGTDYTPYQNNMKIKEIVDRNGNKVNWTIKEAYKRLGSGQAVINELNEKIRTEGWVVSTSKAQTGHGSYGLYENLQETNDPRQTASNFMDWCIGNGTLPLFYQFASHENYYKLIYDYNVYDCVTEEYAPQQAVTNTYPTMVDGQVQPGNVTDGGFDTEYLKGTVDKQMAFMNAYNENRDADLEKLAENMEEGNYSLFSERVSNKELAEMDETALYIKNTDKANYIGMILNGTKTEETRSRRTLDAFIGKEFFVTDGKYVYGSIVMGEPHKYTEAEFHKRENQLKHRVPKGDEYDVKPGGIKWAYPIESYNKFDKPKKLSDSTEYKNSFQAREVLYSGRENGKISLAGQETVKYSNWRKSFPDDVFPPYKPSQSDSHEIAERWSRSKEGKEDRQRLLSHYGKWYVIEVVDNGVYGYRIVDKLDDGDYKRRTKSYGKNGRYKSSRDAFDKSATYIGGRTSVRRTRSGVDSNQSGYRGENPGLSGVDEQQVRWGDIPIEQASTDRSSGTDRNRRYEPPVKMRRLDELSARAEWLKEQIKSDRVSKETKTECRRELKAVRNEMDELMNGYFPSRTSNAKYSDRILMGSLFSGGGTLEAGLVYQMLDKQFGVEFDAKIASVYADNHGDHIRVGKVEDFDISKYDDIFYLHASPVCHNFSKAKHGATELAMDINSARATAKHLETAMPQVFTVENAPGYRKSESLKIITDKLTELGYKWDVDVYNSADYGSATSRNRVILRAVKDGELPAKPAKQERTNSWDKVTRDLWETLPKSYLRPSFISAIENTRNLPILDADGKVNVNKPLLILTTTSGHTVTYCWEGDICPTLTTKCGEARLVMPDGNIYAVTPEFMGRIQGLPDNYQYPKEKTRAFTIIGNGIPTHLTKAVVGGVLDSAYEQTHDGKALYSDRDFVAYDRTAILKEETVDRWLRAYATKSSPKYAQAYIAYMTPDQFLELTTSDYVARSRIESESSKLDVEKFAKATSDQPLFLDIDHETGKVYGHEGRHRCVALQNAGIESVPVLLFDTSNKYSKEDISSILLNGQFNKYHREFVFDAIPLSYENRDRVIQNFGTQSSSQRFWEKTGTKNTLRFQDRTEDSVSNRSLLANAFEGIAKPEELQKIQEYKDKVSLINAEEKKLRELNAEIKKLSFAEGVRDTKRIKALRFDANQAANRINTYDKQLLRLEASQPLQDVLAREKERAYKRAEKKGKEALDAYKEKTAKTQRELLNKWKESRKKAVESHERTVMRNKIRSVVGELNELLLNEDKKHHVPDNLKKAVASALALVNMDTVKAEERAAKYAALIAKETDPDKIDAYTVTMENILRQGEKMGQKLKELRDAYEEIQNSDDPDIANGYDPAISGAINELSQSIGDTSLANMSIEQLSDVYDMYKMVLTKVRDANKSLIESIKESISNRASRVVGEVRRAGGEHKYRASILDPIRTFFWNNAKPVYAMEHIGSEAMTEAYNQVRKGEDTWAKDVTEARAYYLDKSKKYGYDSWDFDKKYTFKSASEQEFELTLEQILSLYAYSKREQAHDHLRLGGFVFDSNIETYTDKGSKLLKYKVNTADAHQITPEILANIISTLTTDQMGFVDEMQNYLSTVMGAKGNEVTMKMYGVKLFKEKFYFPLKSAKQFMFEQNEVSGEVRIKNSGFTNKVVAKANNPVILNNFMDVWANHVNDMSMYHSFVLPLEDFNRIFNYNSPKQEGVPAVSVKGTIQNAYSPAAVNYVKQLITDLNGGAMADPRETLAKSLTARFKKAKVFSSMSVVIQQPSAIARAFALVDFNYFRPTKDGMNHKELWAELKKYAPVAIIKEMGYFDTNMGKSTLDYIKAKEYTTLKEKAKALIPLIGDSNYRDEVLSKLPALADELTWCAIWNAVKRETLDKNPGLDIKSEPFLMLAGARFTEVITKTQVYDSVLARSANMRSKSGLMSMITSFMAEPTTTANMLEDALYKRKRGYKGYATKAFASVAVSIVLNNALVALVYAGRDDDEDETFAEKYMQAFLSGLVDDINPLTYLPFVKDMWSVLQGYDVERSDMSLVSDFADAVKGLVKAYSSEDGDVVGAWHDLAGSISNIGGIPIDNIRREINGAINFFSTLIEDFKGRPTTWGSMGDAVWTDVRNTIPVVGWLPGETKADKLYDAIISGDTVYVDRLKSSYTDKDGNFSQTKYDTALRQALRENDHRIKEAAEARFAGDFTKYKEIFLEIKGEGKFSFDNIMGAINSEVSELEKKAKGADDSKKPTEDEYDAMFDVSMYYTAVVNNDQASAKIIYEELVNEKLAEGYLKHEAEDAIASGFATQVGDAYMDGDISRTKALKLLEDNTDKGESDVKKWDFELEYGFSWSERVRKYRLGVLSKSDLITAVMDIEGESRTGAEDYIRFLDLEMDNSDTDITANDAEGYFKYAQPAGISVNVYLDYKNRASKCESDKDANGKTISGSKKAKVMAVINSLPISKAQKDALYYANGWSENTINEAPWH